MLQATPPSTAIIEAEYSLIASLAYENKRIDDVAEIVTAADFGDPFFADVFGLILSEYAQGRAANSLTLRQALTDHPSVPEYGGDAFFAQLLQCHTLLLDHRETAKLIARDARKRRLLAGLQNGLAEGENVNATIEDIADIADEAIVSALAPANASRSLTGGAALNRFAKMLEQPKHGVKCHRIPSIDTLLGPLRPQQLVVMAGRPGMGKTAAALSYALGSALNGHGTLFVSLEMGADELAARMLCDLSYESRGRVSLDQALSDDPSPDVIRKSVEYAERLNEYPWAIEDAGKMTLGRLAMLVRRHARRMLAKGQKLELVVVDYLQLLAPDNGTRSAYEAVSEISRNLKALAKESGVAVLALAQLSREVEKRADKRPQLSDLRDSGQIEQDADTVLFLLRDEYYLRQNEPEDEAKRVAWEQALFACENKIEFICAKRRNGRTGRAIGNFYTQFQAVRG